MLDIGLQKFQAAQDLTSLQSMNPVLWFVSYVKSHHEFPSKPMNLFPRTNLPGTIQSTRLHFRTRMKAKLESVIKALTDASGKIESLYNSGIVDEFCKEPLCWMSVLLGSLSLDLDTCVLPSFHETKVRID